MSEKKPQETQDQNQQKMQKQDKEKMEKPASTTVPVETAPTHVASVPVFTKSSPNDLYRRLLPAVLFVLTFVTVMTMLLVYMDTVALGAAQFRMNMSRSQELSIAADSGALLQYVRQLQLAPRPPAKPQPIPTRNVKALDELLGVKYNGTFVEILESGGRDQSTAHLETARGWRGLVARANPRDYLKLRGPPSLHACLAKGNHPAEVTYRSPEEEPLAVGFSSRVLCLPLLTMLLAGEASDADYAVLGGRHAPPALANLQWAQVDIKVIEFRSTDPAARMETSRILQNRNYTILREFDDAIMYNQVSLKPEKTV